jgi:NSS family neurotransmitter:Na+ symporter
MYGKNFFDTMNDMVANWLLPVGGLMIAVFTGWVLDKEISKEEFSSGTNFGWLFRPWIFFLKWIAPLAVILIMLQTMGIIDINKLFN